MDILYQTPNAFKWFVIIVKFACNNFWKILEKSVKFY